MVPAAAARGGRVRRAAPGAALAVACAALLTAPATAAEFSVRYDAAPPAFGVYRDELERQRFLESVAEQLNRTLLLPRTVHLRTAACGHSTTVWSAPARVVTVCYEFIEAVLVIAAGAAASRDRAEQQFSGALTFALLAEVGRALVTLYRMPPADGARDAGDEFAAITLAAAERAGDSSAAAALEFYAAALGAGRSFEYLASHGFDRWRLEELACLWYGNAPANHAEVQALGLVPAARLGRCPEELLLTAERWERALRPHARPAPPP